MTNDELCDLIGKKLVELDAATARESALILELDALCAEIGPRMPCDVVTLRTGYSWQPVAFQLCRDSDGTVMAERIDAREASDIEWVEPEPEPEVTSPAGDSLVAEMADAACFHRVNPDFPCPSDHHAAEDF